MVANVWPEVLDRDFQLKSKYLYLFDPAQSPVFSLPRPVAGEYLQLAQFGETNAACYVAAGKYSTPAGIIAPTINDYDADMIRVGGQPHSLHTFRAVARTKWTYTISKTEDRMLRYQALSFYTETNTTWQTRLTLLITNDAAKPIKYIRMPAKVSVTGAVNPKIGYVQLSMGSDTITKEYDDADQTYNLTPMSINLPISSIEETVQQELTVKMKINAASNHISLWYPAFYLIT